MYWVKKTNAVGRRRTALLRAGRKVYLEVNTEKSKEMITFRHMTGKDSNNLMRKSFNIWE